MGIIIPHQSTRSGVNVICALGGLKSRPIPRYAACYSLYRGLLHIAYIQNTKYIVTSGARQKDEDWDPEDNGGFAVHGEPVIARGRPW